MKKKTMLLLAMGISILAMALFFLPVSKRAFGIQGFSAGNTDLFRLNGEASILVYFSPEVCKLKNNASSGTSDLFDFIPLKYVLEEGFPACKSSKQGVTHVYPSAGYDDWLEVTVIPLKENTFQIYVIKSGVLVLAEPFIYSGEKYKALAHGNGWHIAFCK